MTTVSADTKENDNQDTVFATFQTNNLNKIIQWVSQVSVFEILFIPHFLNQIKI